MDRYWRRRLGEEVRSKQGVRELEVRPYGSPRLLANTDTHTGTGLSAGLVLLEFQQVAIDLIVHIGVVFLLTQV